MTSSEIIKVILLGESKVGKTSILYQYQEGKFNPDVQPSNTAQFFRKELNLADKGKATLDIWDMSGATKYRSLAKIFLKDALWNFYSLYFDKEYEDIQLSEDILKSEDSDKMSKKLIIK